MQGFTDTNSGSHSILVEAEHVRLVGSVEHVFDGGADEVGKLFKEGLHLLLGKSAHR